ncbi:MAG: hypothetical protein WD274_02080 [Acidimicrobiia bacterium]
MRISQIDLTRQQTGAIALGIAVVALGGVWWMLSIGGNDTPLTSTTATSAPPSTGTTTAAIETTTTVFETTTTAGPGPTTTFGVFDEVAAVEAFIADFAGAIEEADSAFLFERLHPAVKATYEDDVCRAHIDNQVLPLENYRQTGPVVGPFESEFGEFPITSYEAGVAFDIEGEPMETTAEFSLTEGVVRWLVECS